MLLLFAFCLERPISLHLYKLFSNIMSCVTCFRAANDPAQSSPELTPCPILAVGGSNGSMSRNGSKYGGGGGFTTPTKDYEPVGGDRHASADLNGSSRLNGNGRPDVYDIPSGNIF